MSVDELKVKLEAVLASGVAEFTKLKPVGANWFSFDKNALESALKVVFTGVEQLVLETAKSALAGEDKKALVLEYANKLFDAIVAAEVPLVLTPVIPTVRNLFDSVLSQFIEFVVSKL